MAFRSVGNIVRSRSGDYRVTASVMFPDFLISLPNHRPPITDEIPMAHIHLYMRRHQNFDFRHWIGGCSGFGRFVIPEQTIHLSLSVGIHQYIVAKDIPPSRFGRMHMTLLTMETGGSFVRTNMSTGFLPTIQGGSVQDFRGLTQVSYDVRIPANIVDVDSPYFNINQGSLGDGTRERPPVDPPRRPARDSGCRGTNWFTIFIVIAIILGGLAVLAVVAFLIRKIMGKRR